MSAKRVLRSDSDWMNLITQCRQSGLPDRDWCEAHDIAISSFYNAITRLRKKTCSIPERSDAVQVMDLTTRKQDVVQIDIIPDKDTPLATPFMAESTDSHLDNSHTIEIILNDSTSLRISNLADPALLEAVLSVLRKTSC